MRKACYQYCLAASIYITRAFVCSNQLCETQGSEPASCTAGDKETLRLWTELYHLEPEKPPKQPEEDSNNQPTTPEAQKPEKVKGEHVLPVCLLASMLTFLAARKLFDSATNVWQGLMTASGKQIAIASLEALVASSKIPTHCLHMLMH